MPCILYFSLDRKIPRTLNYLEFNRISVEAIPLLSAQPLCFQHDETLPFPLHLQVSKSPSHQQPENFLRNNIELDAGELVKGCLHSIVTRAGDLIPHPLANALNGEKPNEVLHFDFLYMGLSREGKFYILTIQDEHSGYLWLWTTVSTTTEEALDALVHWIGSFGTINWFVSDQGSQFRNELILEHAAELLVHHQFTTAYSPWANETVEIVCQEVI